MASNRNDSTSSSDTEERFVTREHFQKAKKQLFFSTPTEAATSMAAKAITDRRTGPCTSASKKTNKHKSIYQASTSSGDCPTPSKSPYSPVLTTKKRKAITDRRTGPCTSASKKTKTHKSIYQASTSSGDCPTPSKSPYNPVLTTLSSSSSAESPLPIYELDDTTEDGVSNPKCTFSYCVVNETSSAQCQDTVHDYIAGLSDLELILPGRDIPHSLPVNDDDDIASLPLSEQIEEYDSDATDSDLDGQSPEILQCTEGQNQSNISNLFKNPREAEENIQDRNEDIGSD